MENDSHVPGISAHHQSGWHTTAGGEGFDSRLPKFLCWDQLRGCTCRLEPNTERIALLHRQESDLQLAPVPVDLAR